MRIFNGTKSQVSLPYAGGQRINIGPMSVSGNVGSTDELIALIVTAFKDDELAIIVSGPYELSIASRNPVAVSYIVQSLDDAIRRFSKEEEAPKVEIVEEKKAEEPVIVPTAEEKKAEPVAEKKRGRGRPKKENPSA